MDALMAGYAFTSTLVSELASATWKDKGAGMKAWDKAMQSLEAMGELVIEDEMALRDWLRDRKSAQER